MKYQSKSVFKPRARLLLQLGDQLIKNENIAVLELVKNSYDADARNITIKMERVDDKQFGRIEIIDDGSGMDDDVIKNAWLEPGSDYKAKQYQNDCSEIANYGGGKKFRCVYSPGLEFRAAAYLTNKAISRIDNARSACGVELLSPNVPSNRY